MVLIMLLVLVRCLYFGVKLNARTVFGERKGVSIREASLERMRVQP
jgi:hypothetical protein